MFSKIFRSLEFVKVFLSPDNLEQLRTIVLERSTPARKPVDMGLATLVNSAEDVDVISHTKVKPAALINGYNFITGKTLFTCSPEEHEQYIKTFPLEMVGQRQWILTQEQAVKEETIRFVNEWLKANLSTGDAATVDLARLSFSLTFSLLSKTFLGAGYDAEQQADFELMAKHLNRYLLYQIPPIFPSFYSAKKRWGQRVDKIIADREQEVAAGGIAPSKTDLLSTLIRKNIAIDDLTRRSLSQGYWAGTFTHSAVIQGALFHVARDPEVLAYLLANPQAHGLPVAKEALRMYPGAPIYDRGVAKGSSVTLPSGTVFKEGARPFVCPHIIGTDPVYWPDPRKFDPRRFEGHIGFQSKAFVPFGYAPEEGGRACTGRYFALEVLPWVVSTIFSNFKIKMISEQIQMAEYAACAVSTTPLMAEVSVK